MFILNRLNILPVTVEEMVDEEGRTGGVGGRGGAGYQ